MIDVQLLGTGAMVPLPGRYLSATMFRVGSSVHLIDCGEGTQVAMREHHTGFKALDAIFLTHFHADHIAGLPGLMHTVAHSGKTSPLTIVGPPGTYQVVQGLFVIVGSLPFDVFIREIEGGDAFTLDSGAQISTAYGDHRGPVLAYRFDLPRQRAFLPEQAESLGVPRTEWSRLQAGESVVVSGREVVPDDVLSDERPGVSFALITDTRPTPALVELVKGVDLLISEGTYGDDDDAAKAVSHKHMTYREAATQARDAEVGHLWLTHFGAGMNAPEDYVANAQEVFPQTTLGYSGLAGTIGFDSGYRGRGNGFLP